MSSHTTLRSLRRSLLRRPDEGRKRLERLAALGPTPEAFTFAQTFPAPAA